MNLRGRLTSCLVAIGAVYDTIMVQEDNHYCNSSLGVLQLRHRERSAIESGVVFTVEPRKVGC
jgi:hypothetical protein